VAVIRKLKSYYFLSKPGIIRGNLIVAIASFLLGSAGAIDLVTLIGVSIGTSLVIASACIFNNYYDRGIDALMTRTAKRALVTGAIKNNEALMVGSMVGLVGFLALALTANWLTVAVGIVGWVSYVVIYTYFKKRTSYGTLIGSISGATPPLAGYVAATNSLDLTGLLLFLILVAWQMPHFYAIAIYRKKDYLAARVPVSSIVHGNSWVAREMLFYVAMFMLLVIWLMFEQSFGWLYVAIMLPISLYWLVLSFKGLGRNSTVSWAKKSFFVSLASLLLFSLTISVESFLI
jgi:protoheme IX farnesyltransferase